MTDNEIIKALECCISAENCCECAYTKICDGTTIHQFALDLINRLQAENENYSHNVRNMTESIYKYQKTIVSQKAEIERLKKFEYMYKECCK